MTSMAIITLLAVGLFAVVFFTKRRFGLLGLGLAAGSMLAGLWAGELTPVVANAGIMLVAPPLETVLAAGITLLPALLLLSRSAPAHTLAERLISSSFFVALAVVLLLEPIGAALVLDGVGQNVYSVLTQYKTGILTTCLVYALVDLCLVRGAKAHNSSSKH